MLPAILSLTAAFVDDPRVPLDPPRGRERLSIAVPKGFVLAKRTQGHLVFANQRAQILVDWSLDKVNAPLLKAMKESFKGYRKSGTVMGALKIGPYTGSIVRGVLSQGKLGIDLHAPLVSGHNLLGVTYFDAKADVHTTQKSAQILMQMARNSRYSKD